MQIKKYVSSFFLPAFFSSFLLLLFFPHSFFSASQINGATRDSKAYALSDVNVALESIDGKIVLETKTDLRGKYHFENVEDGTYHIIPSKSGFIFSSTNMVLKNSAGDEISKINKQISLEEDLPSFEIKEGCEARVILVLSEKEPAVMSEISRQLSNSINLINSQKLNEAISLLERITIVDPENVDAFYYLGYSHVAMKEPAQAMDPLTRAIELKPDKEGVHYTMGLAYSQMKENDKALEEFKKEAGISKDQGTLERCYINMGIINRDRGNAKEAIEAFENVLKINKQNLTVYSELADLYLKANDPDRSLEFIERSAKVGTKDVNMIIKVASYYANKGEWEKSEKLFLEAISMDPEIVNLYEKVGHVQEKLGKKQEAAANFSKYLELNPDAPNAAAIRKRLGELLK
ncbi:MAG: tetratricopeptide repeat protein [Acidobacteriota bacterium]